MIQAITNQQVGLKWVLLEVCKSSLDQWHHCSVITELIIGYALPGRPIAMMMFKTWGYIVRKRQHTVFPHLTFCFLRLWPRPWLSLPTSSSVTTWKSHQSPCSGDRYYLSYLHSNSRGWLTIDRSLQPLSQELFNSECKHGCSPISS